MRNTTKTSLIVSLSVLALLSQASAKDGNKKCYALAFSSGDESAAY